MSRCTKIVSKYQSDRIYDLGVMRLGVPHVFFGPGGSVALSFVSPSPANTPVILIVVIHMLLLGSRKRPGQSFEFLYSFTLKLISVHVEFCQLNCTPIDSPNSNTSPPFSFLSHPHLCDHITWDNAIAPLSHLWHTIA
eukprot:sb/3474455/